MKAIMTRPGKPLGCAFAVVAVLLAGGVAGRGQIVLDTYGSSNVVKVMPVGDSITDDCEVNGAWRLALQPLLETNGFPFTFVGRQISNPLGGFTKVNHEGYCGAVVAPPGVFGAHQYSTVQNYLQKVVPDALTAIPNPDVMLVLIGANDIGRGRNPYQVATNDMATLLGLIFSNAPNTQVGLAKITSLLNGGAGGLNYGMYATNVTIYNAVLQKLVNDRRAQGQNVFLADMFSAVDYNTMFMGDHVHPNATGLQAIAREWLTRVQANTVRTDLVTSVLINGGAMWKYNDLGQDLGSNWTQTNYDDSGWGNEIARLGYGDSVAATTVSYGAQSTNKNVTTYFRRTFVVPPNMMMTNLNLRVAESDGAVIYLNGQEIYRTNLPAGVIHYTNLAMAAATYFPRYIFYPTNVPVNLTAGTNWIAAEVHLSSVSAASMGFDMELIGTGNPAPLIGSFRLSVPSAANENAGTLSGQGMVTVSVAPTNDLVVNLRSSDVLAATVPASVLILAGQTNATFDIAIIDDQMVNTGRVAFISAYATSYSSAQASIAVHNTDVFHPMHLSIPAAATEGDGTLAGAGNVSVSPTPTNDLVVNLASGNTGKVTVPATVTIPAGQSNAAFDLTIVDNSLLDGDQIVFVTAAALHYTNTQAAMTVHDNETATLVVTLPASASESAGTLTNAGMVSIGTVAAANFNVSLASSDISKLIVPAATTIANGQTSAVFNLTLVNSNIADVPQTVRVTAHVTNWTDGSASMSVLEDAQPDHFAWSVVPSPQLIGEPFPVMITAQDAANNTMDYRLPVTLSAVSLGNAAGTNTILNSPTAEQSLLDGIEYVLGYSFTPNTNLSVTDVRSYFGDKVTIWTSNGQLVVSQNVGSVAGTWVDTPLAAPVTLLGGSTYLVMVHANGVQYYWSVDLPVTFADGTINQSYWDYGDVFPTQTDEERWYFVDLGYAKGFPTVAISPVATTNFASGKWAGNVAVLQAANKVVLQASSGSGRSGASAPFDVLGTPKLAISLLTNSVLLSWPTAASGFNLEQAATLPNWGASGATPTSIGSRYYVTNSIGGAGTFYRLHKP
jgi:lysophospholipase L1-like esterase